VRTLPEESMAGREKEKAKKRGGLLEIRGGKGGRDIANCVGWNFEIKKSI